MDTRPKILTIRDKKTCPFYNANKVCRFGSFKDFFLILLYTEYKVIHLITKTQKYKNAGSFN